MVGNRHRVAPQQWRKWSDWQRELFNSVYRDVRDVGPGLFLHPETTMTRRQFDTVAWNAAFTAACCLGGVQHG